MFNILVVEDNRDLRELLCDALTGEGYRAYSSSDGNEALTRLEETFFDLIIADIMMPNMDGLQLTEELRRAGIDTPILIVTARDDYETLQSGFTLGADDYMVKPVNVNELLLRVKALLRRAKINTDKKITVGSTVLDFETMSVAVKGENRIAVEGISAAFQAAVLSRQNFYPSTAYGRNLGFGLGYLRQNAQHAYQSSARAVFGQ